MTPKNKGPVEILCEEIGATFTDNMESIPVLKAFISVLVCEISDMVQTANTITRLTEQYVPSGTDKAINMVRNLLVLSHRSDLITAAANAHESPVLFVPDEGPCNHYVDMLSSCVSAIRFGLEQPCRSRHAAAAAHHIWKHRYGITLFDNHSHDWGRQWAKAKFYEALGVAVKKA